MSPELLPTHFNRISEAPDAIPRLRSFILDLAVRGKLVEQDTKEEPASELINRLEGQRPRPGVGAPSISLVAGDKVPFAIPPSWAWSRLGDLCSKTGSGSTPRGGKSVYQRNGVPFLRSQNVYNDGLRLDDVAYISRQTHEKMSGTAVRQGDLLLNITGGSIGRCCLVSEGFGEANVSQHVAIIRVAIDGIQCYLHQLVLSPYFQSFVFSEQTGAGRGGLPKNRMDRIPVALPPLAEQHRIVAKVDELMALCDGLEGAQRELETRRGRLAAASHHFLSNGTNAEAFRKHADFYFNHLPRLTIRPDNIRQLRRTILNLAIRGKLVAQDPNDKPASVLLKQIYDEKALMARSGKIRLRDPLPPIVDAPFDIPASWEWTRLGTLCFLITDGAHHTPKYEDEGVPFLSVKDVSAGTIDFSNTRLISTAAHQELCKRCRPEFGDILLTKVGTTGIAVTVDVKTEFSIFVSLALLKFSKANLNRFYLKHLINSPFVKRQSADNTQGIGNKNLVLRLINQFVVPLPPLAEQQRIVAKVDEMMALCDRLEAQLAKSQVETSRLLESVLHHALNDARSGSARQ